MARGINDEDRERRTISHGHRIEDCKAIGASEKALRVETPNGVIWVPKSVIHDDSEVYEKGHEGDLVVFESFAEREGWT